MAKNATKPKVTFALRAPAAQNVLLAGDFTDWEQKPIKLRKTKGGQWWTSVSLEPGTYEYRFLVDGQWRDDPECPQRRENPFGEQNCVRVVSGL